MFVNVFSLPMINFVEYAYSNIRIWLDRGCSRDKTKTRQKSQEAWQKLATGPEFMMDFRYSQILTTIFIAVMYGAGLPLLYFSTVVNLMLTYWVDKFFRKE
jgi:hypothetical protein